METLKINGDILNLETHLTSYGVAYALEGSRISWDDGQVSVLFNGTREEAGKLLSQAVFYALDPDNGWFTDGATASGKGYSSAMTASPTVSPFFGARAVAPSSSELKKVYCRRDVLLDGLPVSVSETASVMGKPMYWKAGMLTARGGSQLITNLQNGTNDPLVTNFLTPVSKFGALSLTGEGLLTVLCDGTENTYFQTEWSPIPSNGVASLFALMGLWVFPTVARGGDKSVTAGCVVRPSPDDGKDAKWKDRVPQKVDVPTFSIPVSLEKVRSVVSSKNWLDDTPSAKTWVREQRVDSRITFTLRVLGKAGHHAERVGFGERVSVS